MPGINGTGGGGGGATQSWNGGNGGSGIIIIRYLTSQDCTEAWIQHNSTCTGQYTITYTDENRCNTTGGLPLDNGTIVQCSIPEESTSSHTQYVVDANGNIVGVYQNGQLVSQPTVASKQLSIAGQGSGFDIIQWFKDLWKSIFGGK